MGKSLSSFNIDDIRNRRLGIIHGKPEELVIGVLTYQNTEPRGIYLKCEDKRVGPLSPSVQIEYVEDRP